MSIPIWLRGSPQYSTEPERFVSAELFEKLIASTIHEKNCIHLPVDAGLRSIAA